MANRISTSQMYKQSYHDVSEARRNENATARVAGTLKRINVPSDDAKGWRLAKDAKDQILVTDVIAKNATYAKNFLDATDEVLGRVHDFLHQAKVLALSAANGDKTDEQRKAIYLEAKGVYENLLSTINSKFGNRTLLGGFYCKSSAFDAEGQYLGDDGKIEIEIESGEKIPINITGERAVLGVGMQDGVDIPRGLALMLEGMETNDQELIQECLEMFPLAVDQISVARAEVGAWANKIERAVSGQEAERIHRIDLISKIEDADMFKVFSDLARDQTQLKASLKTTEKILQEIPPDVLFK